jgi:hypothetical protein
VSRERWFALSFWQPWAWLVAMGYKPIENRGWATRYRGPDEARIRSEVLARFGIVIPEVLPTGGIVGKADLTDCVTASDSPWFVGRYGFVLADAEPLPFAPYSGERGIFEVCPELVERARQHVSLPPGIAP